MRDYNAYSSGIFQVTEKELSKLVTKEFDLFYNEKTAIEYLEQHFFNKVGITDLRKYVIPKSLKRNNWDSACLLVFKHNDQLWAKRHNNSQWLTV